MLSRAPISLGKFEVDCCEMMFVQYLPIVMPDGSGRGSKISIPRNVACFLPIIASACNDGGGTDPSSYVYLTAKHLFIPKDGAANRPGWHLDGFGTDDINFIWSNSLPTEFCVQEFDLSDDHDLSLQQMETQADKSNIITYPVGSLLRLDNTVVHRVAKCTEDHYRTFVKISISRHQYNLKGNAHNYGFEYDWPMVERQAGRNHPIAMGVA